ncbi:MAG: hypothetical protein V4437_01755 [Patescibacteria group bacterium]
MNPNTYETTDIEAVPKAITHSRELTAKKQRHQHRFFLEIRIVHEIRLVANQISKKASSATLQALDHFQNREIVAEPAFV